MQTSDTGQANWATATRASGANEMSRFAGSVRKLTPRVHPVSSVWKNDTACARGYATQRTASGFLRRKLVPYAMKSRLRECRWDFILFYRDGGI